MGKVAYQLATVAIHDAYTGPKASPAAAAAFQSRTIQTRCSVLNWSSTVPLTTTDGTAEASPERNLPMKTALRCGTAPTRRQDRLNKAQEKR